MTEVIVMKQIWYKKIKKQCAWEVAELTAGLFRNWPDDKW